MNAFRSLCHTARYLFALAVVFALAWQPGTPSAGQANDPTPPEETVRLIFIHHSCGENWLSDGNGNLGMQLGKNNYFVSDTNYGWGPNSIGDNTDIINWPEWFQGSDSASYMAAVYAEAGQNSNYTRTLADPGGENEIVMFKSCYPNSNLDGQPNDPPEEGYDFTVGNAKFIYNSLLTYFETRPDKLFIVITAPPVQDPMFADNARGFNTWLVQDWLNENNYPLSNVAVWDFYNVLSHKDNHHRFNNGEVEYTNSHGDNTSAYASSGDDDHPNAKGNQKATEEFIPMLNIYYNRWRNAGPTEPVVVVPVQPEIEATEPGEEEAQPAAPLTTSDLIDDFEAEAPAEGEGWVAYWDEAVAENRLACQPQTGTAYSGSAALYLNFSIAPESWATCTFVYPELRDWSAAQGLSFYIHAGEAALLLDVIAYGGTADALESYIVSIETTQEMVNAC